MAPHSSTLAWKIPWMEEPGRLQFMGLRRVGHDWVTSLSCIGEGNGNPLQCSCLENPRDGGAWWAAVYRVTQSQTWLKWLSSSIHFTQHLHSVLKASYPRRATGQVSLPAKPPSGIFVKIPFPPGCLDTHVLPWLCPPGNDGHPLSASRTWFSSALSPQALAWCLKHGMHSRKCAKKITDCVCLFSSTELSWI